MKKLILAGALGIAALAGTNLPGLEAQKASAASIESNISTIEGRVVDFSGNAIYIESTQFDSPLRVEVDFRPNVKLGDQVKATGAMMRSFSEYMLATSVEKVQDNTTLQPGFYEKENHAPDFVIGHITKVDKEYYETDEPIDYVIVTAPNKYGKDDIVIVDLTQGQKFNVGDMVKVDFHSGSEFHRPTKTTYDHIEKISDSKTSAALDDQWIWS